MYILKVAIFLTQKTKTSFMDITSYTSLTTLARGGNMLDNRQATYSFLACMHV